MSKRISVAWARQLINEGILLLEEKANGAMYAVTNASLKGRHNTNLITVYFA